MKALLFVAVSVAASFSMALQKVERVSCYANQKLVADGQRTTLSDGKIESSSSQMTYLDEKTGRTTKAQENLVIEIERKGNLEIRKTSGTYVNLSSVASLRKLNSVDTYEVDGPVKTLIKSVVDGKELTLYTTDTEFQVTAQTKVYSSMLKDLSLESQGFRKAYNCQIRLLSSTP